MRDIYTELITQYKLRVSDNAQENSRLELDILLSAEDNGWFYALSPDRGNAAEFIPVRSNSRVLVMGAYCGAYCFLAKRAAVLEISDNDETRREFIRKRFAKDVSAGRIIFTDSPEGLYDLIVLSFLDVAGEKKLNGDSEAVKAIGELSGHLSAGGRIVFSADNAGALKFMEGAETDNGGALIRRETIEKAAKETGLALENIYYPLNNAAFARNIFSDKRLPGAGDFRGIDESFTESRYVLLNDEAVYAGLLKAGAFREFAPSFIAVFADGESVGGQAYEPLPIYAKYNRMRVPEYAIKTEIFESDGHKRAVKTALTPEADRHIEEFSKRAEILNKELNGRINVLPARISRNGYGRSCAEFDFVNGEDLGKLLSEHIKGGAAPVSEINDTVHFILGKPDEPCSSMDSLFENVIKNGSGYTLIDYEWVLEEDIDKGYLRYRMLKYWYEEYSGLLTSYSGLNDFLSAFAIDINSIKAYEEKELKFQEKVRGEYKALEEKFIMPQKYAYDAEKVVNKLNESLDKVDYLETALEERKETDRLTRNHIRNIEEVNRIRENDIESLNKRINYLEKHRTLSSKLIEKLVAGFDRWAPAGSKKRAVIHCLEDAVRTPKNMLGLFLNGFGSALISGYTEIGDEFREGGFLKLPVTAEPLVSIVIPAYNQVAYTYACIRSIIANTDASRTPYEVILADDVSTDATTDMDKYADGIVISRNTSNMGFLKNCNQAAKKARGKYILFLNNDTKVHENWLSSLVRLIESDDTIGMVGSKLIYPDGRLQEAGGIIWSDASGWNYGRMDDPDKPEYNYVKDVDYISGAAIMINKALWDEISGFDERFAPAYCEDSDLAFEVRKHGKRVVYQPESVVTHFEGVSNGTDVEGSGLKRYQVLNNEKFKEKWAEELKKQCAKTAFPDPFSARDRSSGKPCVAVVDHYIPTWDRDAGSKTTYQYIRMFIKNGFNVKFIGDNFLKEEPYASSLEQLGVEILYGSEYENGILEWFRKNAGHIDICYLNRPHIADKYIDFLKDNTDIRCIFYGHDLHSLRLMREYELTGDAKKLKDAKFWKSVEFSVMEKADRVYYPSETEVSEILKERPWIKAKAITAYVWNEFMPYEESAEEAEKRRDLLFVGGFKHPPNADAVRWFIRDVFPKIRKAIPDVRFLVAGSGADGELEALNDPENGTEILGFVTEEKLEELYKKTRLTVVPLRYGAGVKGKVVEALYNNAAVVTTSVGAEGIPDADKAMVVTDTASDDIYTDSENAAEEFADAVIRIYNDEAACMGLRKSAESFVKLNYSMEAAWQKIADDFMVTKK